MNTTPAGATTGEFFIGGGEMGALMRSLDWSQTSLGAIGTWPQSLKTALNILFSACCPMVLVWGRDRILFYNDTYAADLSDRDYPMRCGQSLNGQVSAGWSRVRGDVEQVFATQQSWQCEQFPARQGDRPVQSFLWCYSPLWDESGQMSGVFASGYPMSAQAAVSPCDQSDHPGVTYALHPQEEQLHLITNALPVLIAYVDKDHYYRFNNQTYESWFGQPASTFTNRLVREILGEPAYAKMLPYMTRALAGELVSFESQIPYPDGRTRYISADYVPHRNAQGVVEGYFSLVSDISDRKRAEAARQQAEVALRESEADFSAMFNLTSVGMAQADAKTRRLLCVNAAFCAITGYTEAELLAMRVDDLNHPDDRDRDREQFADLVKGRSPTYQTEKRYLRKDGQVSWVSVTGNVIQDVAGQPTRVAAVIQDITERKQTEDNLRASEERFRLVTQAVNGLIFDWNLQTNEVYRSEKLADLVGVSPDCIAVGADWWHERIHPDDLVRLQPLIAALFTSTNLLYESEYRVRHEAGHWVDVWEQACLIRDDQGQILRIVGCTVNISDRKRTEAALRQSEERLRVSQELSLDAFTILDSVRDAAGRIVDFVWTYVNPKAAEILKHPATELIGQRLLAVLPGNQLNGELFQRYRQVVETGESHDIELSYAADGITGWFRNMAIKLGDGVAIFFSDITERKRIEEALKTSEERLRFAIEGAALGTWEYDLASRKIIWSDRAKLMFGVPLDVDVTYDELIQVLHPDDRDRIHAAVESAIAEHTLYDAEMQTIWPDQSVHCVRSIGRARYTEQGVPTRMFGVVLDMTERKRAEAALQRSEERLRLAMEAAQMATWDVDLLTGEAIWSDQHFLMLGYPPMAAGVASEDLWISRIHPDDLGQVLQEWQKSRQERRFYRTEYRAIRADNGQVSWLAALGSFTYDDHGDAVRSIGVLFDISDRKQAEAEREQLLQEMATERTHLEAILRQMPAAVIIAEAPSGKLLLGNQQVEEIWRHPFLSSTTIDEYEAYQGMHADGRLYEPEEWPLARSLLTGEVVTQEEIRLLRGDGTEGIVEVNSTPVYNPQGQIISGVVIFQDITQRKQAEAEREKSLQQAQAAREEAETANRIKDEFLAVLSHELRSPLNPILGWAKLLQTKQFDFEATQRALQTIERNAQLQTQLIEDLLDVSRILRGKMALNMFPVNLATVVESAPETVRLAAEAKQIQITLTITAPQARTLGDSARLQQIVWNLLSNAVKFTPTGGHVEVRLDQVGGAALGVGSRADVACSPGSISPSLASAQITVTDTGKGIRPDFLPYVFDYFRQEDGKTTRKFGGLGLGLAIVRHLTELHGGTVQAESLGEAQGASFVVCLPLMQTATESHKNQSNTTSSTNLTRLKVLVVDDDEDMRNLVQIILEQQGIQVYVAANAPQALMLFEQHRPDLCISDIGMPEVDGYMLIQQIRRRSPEQGGLVPAIALTAYAGETDQQQVLAAGFQQHLPKPVDPDTLIAAIAALANQEGEQ